MVDWREAFMKAETERGNLAAALTAALSYLPERQWIGGTENGYWQTSGAALLAVRAQAIAALGPKEAAP